MRAWTRGDFSHCGFTASSPPTWMYSPGKTSMHLGQHVLEEAEGGLLDVEQVFVDAPVRRHRVQLVSGRRHAELADTQRWPRVAWPGISISGHDLDVARGGVGHDVARLLLRVEAAVQSRLAGLGVDVGLRGACPAGTRHAPTEVSFGYFLISRRQAWSSVRCQCSTLSLCSAIQSMNCLMNSGDW